MIFIIKGFWTLVFIFIIISTTFRPIYPPVFIRCLSNSGTYSELRTTSFIVSTGVACSESVSHNQIQVLSIPVSLLARNQDWTCYVQQDTLRNGYRRLFSKLLWGQSSGDCRFNPDCRIKYQFSVFGMTRPGIEPRSSGPLANTLHICQWLAYSVYTD